MTNFTNSKDELAAFKHYPIHDLLPHLGWTLDETAKGNGKKSFIFSRDSEVFSTFRSKFKDQFWMAKNFQTGETRTIIDFALEEASGNFGQMRKLLRELTSTPAPSQTRTPAPSQTSTTPPSSSTCPNSSQQATQDYKSTSEVGAEYRANATVWRAGDRLPNFLDDRGVKELGDQFDSTFSVSNDAWQNVRFPYDHFDGNILNLCAVEEKNHDFKRYTTGGRAGVWVARGDAHAPWIVCESPVDCLSFDLMSRFALQNAREGIWMNYVAVRSGAEDAIVDFLNFEHKVRRYSNLVLATDNDAAGAMYASKIMVGLRKLGKDEGLVMRMSHPALAFTDWNEALMRKRETEQVYQSHTPRPSPGTLKPAPVYEPMP